MSAELNPLHMLIEKASLPKEERKHKVDKKEAKKVRTQFWNQAWRLIRDHQDHGYEGQHISTIPLVYQWKDGEVRLRVKGYTAQDLFSNNTAMESSVGVGLFAEMNGNEAMLFSIDKNTVIKAGKVKWKETWAINYLGEVASLSDLQEGLAALKTFKKGLVQSKAVTPTFRFR